ncbi:ABC transporter ATP-binding protein [Candidatus Nitrosacidococcus tergens]|uniref:Toluene transporter subunit: ATP-binding component of ABC superfamily n=1 Tax=Candidatus Nitrosacidococcus tergens TaxID=553981 RepID=A0A7G1QBJ7_9GAMM|nr:ABC transporter ATP-binding protein [Candidatus Nitrosacidococcus tergens]CAB1277249.1 toluene transporter subunit: ATP-binding component of ABC superfamily [Candidatus Nitrosacidococcus tergens]
MKSNNPLVTMQNMHFSRGARSIFNGVDINIERGKITTIMGPSGTGKTTLLRLIGKQLSPTQGTIDIDGQNLANLSNKALYTLRKRIGMLFQSSALLTGLSVFDNVAFPLREHTNLSKSMIRDLVLIKLQAVGLRNARHLMPSELSGGMARRVALARAIALDPMMIMYDEPFTGQDPISMGALLHLIRSINDTLGLTSIIVSHDVQEAASISDYIYILSNGKIIDQGTPDQIKESTQESTKQFIQGLPDGPVPFHYPGEDYRKDLLDLDNIDDLDDVE